MATGLMAALIYQGLYAATLSRLIQIHFGNGIGLFGLAVGAATLGGTLQAVRWGWEPWLAPWFGLLSDKRFGRRPRFSGWRPCPCRSRCGWRRFWARRWPGRR